MAKKPSRNFTITRSRARSSKNSFERQKTTHSNCFGICRPISAACCARYTVAYGQGATRRRRSIRRSAFNLPPPQPSPAEAGEGVESALHRDFANADSKRPLSHPKSAIADFGIDAQTGSARFAKRGRVGEGA
ncbi:MAG: hypothetical protein FJX16_09090 [Alphaproteobacteria bacterium]|nr:hypothetical protein [Alphaproteobacteria bacterium]